jgi:hypothetical protein
MVEKSLQPFTITPLGSWLLYTQPVQTKELGETLEIPFWLDYPEFASHGYPFVPNFYRLRSKLEQWV